MTTRMRPFPQARTRQPPANTQIRKDGLARGLVVTVDGFPSLKSAVGSGQWVTVAGLPTLSTSAKGLAWDTSGAVRDLWCTIDGPLAATAPWTFATTIVPTANVSLSHVFGFGMEVSGSDIESSLGANDGTYRGLLNFNNNYYFWGHAADWDTGIPFDTDGSPHIVMFVHNGTSITFYRDGLGQTSTARPAGLIATPTGRNVVLGNRHSAGTNSPSAKIVSGRVWSRGLSDAEAFAYARNEWQVFASQAVWLRKQSSAPAAPVYGTLGQFDPELRIAGWF